MRKSDKFLAFTAIGSLLLTATFVEERLRRQDTASHLASLAGLVGRLELTDISLFTEARYTRHLTQADLHTPAQDHPFAIEHFPSGSLVAPPSLLMNAHESIPAQTTLPD